MDICEAITKVLRLARASRIEPTASEIEALNMVEDYIVNELGDD